MSMLKRQFLEVSHQGGNTITAATVINAIAIVATVRYVNRTKQTHLNHQGSAYDAIEMGENAAYLTRVQNVPLSENRTYETSSAIPEAEHVQSTRDEHVYDYPLQHDL